MPASRRTIADGEIHPPQRATGRRKKPGLLRRKLSASGSVGSTWRAWTAMSTALSELPTRLSVRKPKPPLTRWSAGGLERLDLKMRFWKALRRLAREIRLAVERVTRRK